MTLQEILKDYKAEWVKKDIVKVLKFYFVHVGDGILYFGTKHNLKIVNKCGEYTFMYKIYDTLLDIKRK